MIYDVVVAGGGPAGSSAARRCSQLGMNVLLIDKAIFPRDKLCGGAVSESALSYLDFDLPPGIIEREIYGARVHFNDTCLEIRTPYRFVNLVSRAVFDHALLEKAKAVGSTVVEGTMVTGLHVKEDCVQISTNADSYQGRVVIGCDGFHSVTAKYVRRPHRKNEYGICMETIRPASETEISDYIEDAVAIYFNVSDKGYGWVFPHRGYFSIGVGGIASQIGNPKTLLEGFLAAAGFPNDVRAKGYPIPAGGFKRSLSADRILLAGDAAGIVDPLTGEGIAYAIRSGQLAAETAASAVRKGDCSQSGLKPYVKACEKAIIQDLRYSLAAAQLMHRYPNIFLRLIACDREALSAFIDVAARRMTYRRYFWGLIRKSPFLLARSIWHDAGGWQRSA
jgi:geranylgeranyl reductase family protein